MLNEALRADQHRLGIGSQLMERFEDECSRQGSRQVKVAATLYAVPFYSRIGYKKTTACAQVGVLEVRDWYTSP